MARVEDARRRASPPLRGSPADAGYRRQTSADARETAEYICAMIVELATLSGAARLDLLTYFLNLARIEAQAQMRHEKRP